MTFECKRKHFSLKEPLSAREGIFPSLFRCHPAQRAVITVLLFHRSPVGFMNKNMVHLVFVCLTF